MDFAESLARYLLDRYKTPFTHVDAITVHSDSVIGGVNVFSLRLFDPVAVTDPQTGISAMLCRIIGLALSITPQGFSLTWHTERQDDRVYWALGVAGHAELGATTRLAV